MKLRFSLHRTRKQQECGLCGTVVPARVAPDYAEYWRVKGGDRATPRVLCCTCHAIYDLPTDGWSESPDGVTVMAASVPQPG